MKTIKIKDSTHNWLIWIQAHLGKEGQLKTLDGTIEYLFDFWNCHYKGINNNDK